MRVLEVKYLQDQDHGLQLLQLELLGLFHSKFLFTITGSLHLCLNFSKFSMFFNILTFWFSGFWAGGFPSCSPLSTTEQIMSSICFSYFLSLSNFSLFTFFVLTIFPLTSSSASQAENIDITHSFRKERKRAGRTNNKNFFFFKKYFTKQTKKIQF